MVGAVFPPCWLFGLRWPSTGAYKLFIGANGSLRGLLPMGTFQNCWCQCPLHEPQLLSHLCQRPPMPAGRSGPISCWVTAPFPWVLVHTGPCLCPSRVEFLFLSVLWKSYNLIPLAFKARHSRASLSCYLTPQLSCLIWGSGLSLQRENFCGIVVLQSVSCPPDGYGTWFYPTFTLPTVSPLCL